MAKENLASQIVNSIFKIVLSVQENPSREIIPPKKILIVRQHNQLGDLLAGVSLFRALKETFPDSQISLVVSPFNYPGMVKIR
ncbi:MAG: ADP-heptose--LPS heptosyltransferase, partial [Ignavibacteriaceae bacterium]|nr:ADP-heptose--LPS heptosyltransferase [Ignavibacteriaceae bacterium]